MDLDAQESTLVCPTATPIEECDAASFVAPDVQRQCDELVGADAIDKKAALGIVRIHHAMETRFIQLRYERDAEIERLRSELQITRLSHRQAEMLNTLSSDVVRLNRDIGQLSEAHTSMSERLGQLSQVVTTLSAQASTSKRSR